jgi:hemoglobin
MRIYFVKVLSVGILLFAFFACSIPQVKPSASLYQRLGEKPALEEVVSDFLQKVGSDTRITNEKVKESLAKVDQTVLKNYLVEMMCQATGGPCQYHGRDMKTSHAGLRITNAEFDHVVDDLVQTLDQYKVPQKEKSELLAILAPLRSDIVEVR